MIKYLDDREEMLDQEARRQTGRSIIEFMRRQWELAAYRPAWQR